MTKPQYSSYEKDERAADAKALLEHPLLIEVMDTLHQSYIAVLIASDVGSQEAMSAQAGLRAIQHIRAYVGSIITDQKMDRKIKERNVKEREYDV